MLLREAIERASWPDEGWSDPALLLWCVDHPPDSISEARRLEDPPGVQPQRPSARSSVAARIYQGWEITNGEAMRRSCVDMSGRLSRDVGADLRWVEQEGPGGIRRTLGGGVEFHGLGWVSDVAIGDYRFGTAEGLIFGSGLITRGGRRSSGVIPEVGVMIPGLSGGGYAGAIVRCALPSRQESPELTICYSKTVLDRTRIVPGLVEADEETGGAATGQPAGGTLRGLTEQLWGLRLRWPFADWLAAGTSAAAIRLEGADEHGVNRSGQVRFVGLDVGASARRGSLSMELSLQSPGILAACGRLELGLGRPFRFAAGGRVFGDGYWNSHASGTSGDGDARSERSAWAWCSAEPLPWLSMEASTEFARRISFCGVLPLFLSASRTAARVDIEPSEDLRLSIGLSFRGHEEICAVADPAAVARQGLMDRRTWIGRAELRVTSGRRLEWSIRLAGTAGRDRLDDQIDRGFLLGAGFRWEPAAGVRLECRWNVFDTDSYTSRIYLGEQVIPGRARFVMLYGEGERTGIWLRLRPGRTLGVALAAMVTCRRVNATPAGVRCAEYSAQLDIRI
jgi:hypothetical protein